VGVGKISGRKGDSIRRADPGSERVRTHSRMKKKDKIKETCTVGEKKRLAGNGTRCSKITRTNWAEKSLNVGGREETGSLVLTKEGDELTGKEFGFVSRNERHKGAITQGRKGRRKLLWEWEKRE